MGADGPRELSKLFEQYFAAGDLDRLMTLYEKDAMFPGDAVVRRAREIFPNLTAAECLKGGTHYSSRRDMATILQRIRAFIL